MLPQLEKPFGEIIESSLTLWRGQSWQWDYFPPFGSIITLKTQELTLLGIIYEVHTGSSDPGREPYAYQKTEAQLKQEQPQIFAFLRTTFSALPIGYLDANGTICYQIPPIPPKIHTFAAHAEPDIICSYLRDSRFLPMLWQSSNINPLLDELMLSLLTTLQKQDALTRDFLYTLLAHYSLLSGNDYKRLKLFSNRLCDIRLANAEPIRVPG